MITMGIIAFVVQGVLIIICVLTFITIEQTGKVVNGPLYN